MPQRTNELSRVTLFLLVTALLLLYPVTVLFVGHRQSFEIGNVILLSMSIGIVVAYTPDVLDAMSRRMIDGGGMAAISVWLCYAGIATGRLMSIAWRLAGKPPGWLDTTIWASQNTLLLAAAVTLTLAPQAVAGRVPPKQWLKLGITTAISVFAAAWYVVVYITDD
jgi:hypothetical protein